MDRAPGGRAAQRRQEPSASDRRCRGSRRPAVVASDRAQAAADRGCGHRPVSAVLPHLRLPGAPGDASRHGCRGAGVPSSERRRGRGPPGVRLPAAPPRTAAQRRRDRPRRLRLLPPPARRPGGGAVGGHLRGHRDPRRGSAPGSGRAPGVQLHQAGAALRRALRPHLLLLRRVAERLGGPLDVGCAARCHGLRRPRLGRLAPQAGAAAAQDFQRHRRDLAAGRRGVGPARRRGLSGQDRGEAQRGGWPALPIGRAVASEWAAATDLGVAARTQEGSARAGRGRGRAPRSRGRASDPRGRDH